MVGQVSGQGWTRHGKVGVAHAHKNRLSYWQGRLRLQVGQCGTNEPQIGSGLLKCQGRTNRTDDQQIRPEPGSAREEQGSTELRQCRARLGQIKGKWGKSQYEMISKEQVLSKGSTSARAGLQEKDSSRGDLCMSESTWTKHLSSGSEQQNRIWADSNNFFLNLIQPWNETCWFLRNMLEY